MNTITTVSKDNVLFEQTLPKDYKRCETTQVKILNGKQYVYDMTYPYTLRYLTSEERFRLMGISQEDFKKAKKVVSETQLQKQAGNAIVVDVLEKIFNNVFVED